jgi:hypothetical protein
MMKEPRVIPKEAFRHAFRRSGRIAGIGLSVTRKLFEGYKFQ